MLHFVLLLLFQQTQEQWQLVFYINLAIQCSGAILFLLFLSTDILPWATVEVDDTEFLAEELRMAHKLEKHAHDNIAKHDGFTVHNEDYSGSIRLWDIKFCELKLLYNLVFVSNIYRGVIDWNLNSWNTAIFDFPLENDLQKAALHETLYYEGWR